MNGVIHVLIVDDRPLVRELLSDRLNREHDLRAEALGSAEACIELTRSRMPSVVMMRSELAGMCPRAAARTIAAISPTTKLLMIGPVRDSQIEEALRAGFHGYLTEQQSCKALLDCIRAAGRGECWFAPEIQSRIVTEGKTARIHDDRLTLLSTLSDREREVLIQIASGLACKEIAQVMHLSTKTVETHAANIMKKLSLRDRVALTRYAIREGLVSP